MQARLREDGYWISFLRQVGAVHSLFVISQGADFDLLVSTRQILAVARKVYSLIKDLTTLDCRFLPLNCDSKVICRRPFLSERKNGTKPY